MARKTHQGKYAVINKQKYIGDPTKVFFRSGWEKNVMRWLDLNDDVIAFSSEETVIPYFDPTTNMIRRYYIDFTIKYKSGSVVLVEVKPKHETREPEAKKGKKVNTLMEEKALFEKNKAKWDAAEAFAKRNKATFQVWNEDVLEAIGIPLNRPWKYSKRAVT